MTVGERLRAERLRRGMTLADVAGGRLSVALVSKVERGQVNPSLTTLEYLAQRLGLSLARLLDGGHAGRGAALESRRLAARARLLLGDPATAAAEALAAAAEAGVSEAGSESGAAAPADTAVVAVLRVRLLGLAAEALFAAGQVPAAAARLVEASGAFGAGGGSPPGSRESSPGGTAASAELAWVLGLLERRRGNVAGAERSWGRCLDALEALDRRDPVGELLRASVLAELAGLHEAAGNLETARNFVARAAAVAGEAANPVRAAEALLGAAGASPAGAGHEAAGLGEGGGPEAAQSLPAMAAALAAVAAADRLARQLAQERIRLERAGRPRPAQVPVQDVPHSRHLQ